MAGEPTSATTSTGDDDHGGETEMRFKTVLTHLSRPGVRIHGFVNPPVQRGSTVIFPTVKARNDRCGRAFLCVAISIPIPRVHTPTHKFRATYQPTPYPRSQLAAAQAIRAGADVRDLRHPNTLRAGGFGGAHRGRHALPGLLWLCLYVEVPVIDAFSLTPTHHQITSSGLCACTIAILSFLKAGDHVLLPDSVYGPVRLSFAFSRSRGRKIFLDI